MSMEERLQAMGVDQKGAKSGSAREPPKADTMSTLLSQGLQSHDKKILSVSDLLVSDSSPLPMYFTSYVKTIVIVELLLKRQDIMD